MCYTYDLFSFHFSEPFLGRQSFLLNFHWLNKFALRNNLNFEMVGRGGEGEWIPAPDVPWATCKKITRPIGTKKTQNFRDAFKKHFSCNVFKRSPSFSVCTPTVFKKNHMQLENLPCTKQRKRARGEKNRKTLVFFTPKPKTEHS